MEVLYKRIYCSPCVHEVDEPLPGNNVCMQRIAVDEVVAAVDRILMGAGPTEGSARSRVLLGPGFPTRSGG